MYKQHRKQNRKNKTVNQINHILVPLLKKGIIVMKENRSFCDSCKHFGLSPLPILCDKNHTPMFVMPQIKIKWDWKYHHGPPRVTKNKDWGYCRDNCEDYNQKEENNAQ